MTITAHAISAWDFSLQSAIPDIVPVQPELYEVKVLEEPGRYEAWREDTLVMRVDNGMRIRIAGKWGRPGDKFLRSDKETDKTP